MPELDFLATQVLRRMKCTTISLDEFHYWGTVETADHASVMILLRTGMIKHTGTSYGITEEGRAHIRGRDDSCGN